MALPVPVDAEDHRALPVALSDLKEHLRIEHNEQDRLLLRALLGATTEAEQYLNAPIMARSFDLVLNQFPATHIELNNPPILSITSITYYDSNGDSQTFDSANYYLLHASAFPEIRLVPDASWPDTQSRENAVTVRYIAGFATKASAVPSDITWAITMRAASRYEMPQESGFGGSMWNLDERLAFGSLLNPYRNVNV